MILGQSIVCRIEINMYHGTLKTKTDCTCTAVMMTLMTLKIESTCDIVHAHINIYI